jgi:hypothetical protein
VTTIMLLELAGLALSTAARAIRIARSRPTSTCGPRLAPRSSSSVGARARRNVTWMDMNQNNKGNDRFDTSKAFLANVLRHDGFRKGATAAVVGTLFAIASVALFGPAEGS